MEIISLSIVGSKRLLHKGTKEVHYTPESHLQLIIGKNGFGKSSIMHYLSPLPPNKKEFIKGGYKEIRIKHNDSLYVLRSDFSKGNDHSFIKDGQELNDGRTQTVQKQLAEQHFSYNQDIHDLLIGKVRFSDLPTAKRKEWLVRICNTDVSYAMALYSRLTQSSRKVAAAKEHYEKKIIDESSKLLSAEEYEAAVKAIELIAEEDSCIISNLNFAEWTSSHSEKYRQLETSIKELSHKVFSSKLKPKVFTDESDLDGQYITWNNKLQGIESKIQVLDEQYEFMSGAINTHNNAMDKSLSELQRDFDECVAQLNTFTQDEIEEAVQVADIDAIIEEAHNVHDSINHILLSIPVNPHMELYNRTTVSLRKNEVRDLQLLIDKLQYAITTSEKRIDEIRSHDEITCVNCDHKWVPGGGKAELERRERLLVSQREDLVNKQKLLDEHLAWLQGSAEWVQWYKQYTALTINYPRLRSYFDSLIEDSQLYNSPASLVGSIDKYTEKLLAFKQLKKTLSNKEFLEEAIQRKKLLDQTNISTLGERFDYLVAQLEAHYHDKAIYEEEIAAHMAYRSQVKELIEVSREIESKMVEYCKLIVQYSQYRTNKELRELLATNADKVKQLNETVADARSSISIVDHLRKNVAELELDKDAYALLLSELSPSEGLIAETLGSFGNVIATQMNDVISHVWSTPLYVRPCKVVDGDLDYRFPLASEDFDDPTDDISMGSEGEKEIIDFAFMLIARIYLKLGNYPLHLDEVGKMFHDTHKVALYGYIKQLLEANRVGQVFIISHSPTAHATLTHADINVIDPSGIMVTPDANRCMRLV